MFSSTDFWIRSSVVNSEQYCQLRTFGILELGQYPLILAWALTIHKIQGATLDLAEIDVGNSIFEYGQTYVALSRVKSLKGLYLTSFDYTKIMANPKVKTLFLMKYLCI